MSRGPATIGLLLVVALSACRETTEIMLAISTDLAIPDRLSGIRIRVEREGLQPSIDLQWTLDGTTRSLPATIGLLPRRADSRPVTVTVEAVGVAGGSLTRRARLPFAKGRTLLLRMPLLGRCIGVPCGVDETCDDSAACAGVDVDPMLLPEYTPDASLTIVDASAVLDKGPSPCGPETSLGLDAVMLTPLVTHEATPRVFFVGLTGSASAPRLTLWSATGGALQGVAVPSSVHGLAAAFSRDHVLHVLLAEKGPPEVVSRWQIDLTGLTWTRTVLAMKTRPRWFAVAAGSSMTFGLMHEDVVSALNYELVSIGATTTSSQHSVPSPAGLVAILPTTIAVGPTQIGAAVAGPSSVHMLRTSTALATPEVATLNMAGLAAASVAVDEQDTTHVTLLIRSPVNQLVHYSSPLAQVTVFGVTGASYAVTGGVSVAATTVGKRLFAVVGRDASGTADTLLVDLGPKPVGLRVFAPTVASAQGAVFATTRGTTLYLFSQRRSLAGEQTTAHLTCRY